jgi:hypothetical protein
MSDFNNPYSASSSMKSPAAASQPTEVPHSGLGITGFILALISALGMLATFISIGIIAVNDPTVVEDEGAVTMMLVGLAVIGFGFLSLLALGLSFGSLFQRSRKKLFGILGLVISGMLIFGTGGIMVLGAVAG